MIPRIIHFCWLSGEPYPPLIQRCLDSWHQVLTDYEFRLWDTKRFNINGTRWTREAFKAGMYAFAADYIRLYALYTEGGIYLDCDVLMYKPFDDLLQLPYFLGEDRVHYFEPAIIGAEAGTPWIADILSHYTNRTFQLSKGVYDLTELPKVFIDRLSPKWKFQIVTNYKDTTPQDPEVIRVFSYHFFNSRNFVQPVRYRQSYCSHCFAGSWLREKEHSSYKLFLPKWLLNMLHWLFYHLYNHYSISHHQVPYIGGGKNSFFS